MQCQIQPSRTSLEFSSLFLVFFSLEGANGLSIRCNLSLMSVEKIRVEDFSRGRFSLCVRNSAATLGQVFLLSLPLSLCNYNRHPSKAFFFYCLGSNALPTYSKYWLFGCSQLPRSSFWSCSWQVKVGQWHPPLDDLRAFFRKQGSNNGDVATRKEVPLPFTVWQCLPL